ncbi:MAG: hypothetical protein PHE88_03620 [Elusimicrobia bacterium]|nr:hypothetical protein [Elusimicrobiota bacterium]
MIEYAISKTKEFMQAARDNYGVNPVIFLVIYLVCVPFFYYSLFRIFRSFAKRLMKEVMFWSTIFLCATVAPFLYVLFFGRNIPWWVYGIVVLIIGQAVLSLVLKLQRVSTAGAK